MFPMLVPSLSSQISGVFQCTKYKKAGWGVGGRTISGTVRVIFTSPGLMQL